MFRCKYKIFQELLKFIKQHSQLFKQIHQQRYRHIQRNADVQALQFLALQGLIFIGKAIPAGDVQHTGNIGCAFGAIYLSVASAPARKYQEW